MQLTTCTYTTQLHLPMKRISKWISELDILNKQRSESNWLILKRRGYYVNATSSWRGKCAQTWTGNVEFVIGQRYPNGHRRTSPKCAVPYRALSPGSAVAFKLVTKFDRYVRLVILAYLRATQSSSSFSTDEAEAWSTSATAGSSFLDHSSRHDVTRTAIAHGSPRRILLRQATTTMMATGLFETHSAAVARGSRRSRTTNGRHFQTKRPNSKRG